jgi:hypothetical protein
MTEGGYMAKVVISFGYKSYVVDGDKALQIMELLQGAEQYEYKYRAASEGGTTHHVFESDLTMVDIKFLPNELYQMYKLAGKPE